MGFVLNLATPYFEGKAPMTGLDSSDYTGKPVQRYLKMAWAYSKDNKAEVDRRRLANKSVDPKLDALATVHTAIAGQVDGFITGLVVDGAIGDELKKPANAGLLPPLAQFAKAFTDAIVAMAVTDKSSRLSKNEQRDFGSRELTDVEKRSLFSEWRDHHFADSVKAATKRGVRYAGMGQNHLNELRASGLDKNQHPYEMNGEDMNRFTSETNRLRGKAQAPGT
jgi:hypothetical protein